MRNAPPPQYNDRGRPYSDWLVVVRYDALRDALTLSWTVDGTPWAKSQQGAQAFNIDDWDDFKGAVETRLHHLVTPRIF